MSDKPAQRSGTVQAGDREGRMTNETKLPKRRANTWPVLMECAVGEYNGAVALPAWKVTRCTASKEGGYLLRVFPADAQVIEPFQWEGEEGKR